MYEACYEMEDSWRLAGEAYHFGTREASKRHLSDALAATPSSSSLQRTILQINLHAVSTHSQSAPPPPLPATSFEAPSIRLLAEEAFLTATYNATLHALHRNSNASLDPLRRAVESVPGTLKLFARGSMKYNSDVRHVVADSTPINIVIDRVAQQPESIDSQLRSTVRRWADAAATCYDLLTAGSVLQKGRSTKAITISKSLRHLINALASPKSCDSIEEYDDNSARSDYLQIMSEGVQITDHSISSRLRMPDHQIHLPLAYLTGVKQLLVRDPDARRLLEICASRSYRLGDSLSLLARLEKGQFALQAWQRAFAVDVRRPVGLWLAAREFGRVGKYAQQAQILACLEQLLESDAREYKGIKIESLKALDDMDDVHFDNVVTSSAVSAERARALCSAGEWNEVKEIMNGLKDDASVRADVLRDRALCAICLGDVREGLSLAETAKVVAAGPTDSAGALLVQAEGLLHIEEVEKARGKVMDAFREAKLGMVGMSWEAEAPRLLRGVCFHNLAILHYCINENVAADECFAAAETAFRKCEDECKELAARMRILSGFARCLVMWRRGMREDAAEYWRAVRELNMDDMEEDYDVDDEEDVRPDSHVVCDIKEEVLQRFDEICLKVCREVEKRKEMEKMMEVVEKEWPLGQKRRRSR